MATYRSWAQSGVTQRANSTAYSLGDRMQPLITDTSTNHAVAKRYVWECTTAGTSGASVPAWSASYTVDSSTITDGTVTWTCRAPGYSSGSTVDWSFASIYAYYTTQLMADGDTLLVHYTSQEASNNYALALAPTADRCRIISVDKDSSEVYTPMGTSGYLGNGLAISAAPSASELRIEGLTLRSSSTSGSAGVLLGTVDNGQLIGKDLRLELSTNSSNQSITIASAADVRSNVSITGLTISRNGASQIVRLGARVRIYGGATAGTGAVTTVFTTATSNDSTGVDALIVGMDLTGGATSSTATLVTDSGVVPAKVTLAGCILPSSYAVLSGAGNLNESGVEVLLTNCKAGSTSGIHLYANALGSMQTNTTITHDGESYSWKIDANASASRAVPFRAPWIWGQVDTGASITPRFEILRNDSTSALTDAQVWCEQGAEVTASSPIKTFDSSEAAYSSSGSNIATGAGTSAWAGESGTAWSGKVDCGAITPTGDELMMRLCVATTTPVYLAQRPYW